MGGQSITGELQLRGALAPGLRHPGAWASGALATRGSGTGGQLWGASAPGLCIPVLEHPGASAREALASGGFEPAAKYWPSIVARALRVPGRDFGSGPGGAVSS